MNETDNLHPYRNFALYTFAVQAIMWISIILFDVAEECMSDLWILVLLLAIGVIVILPIAAYIKYRKKFYTGTPVKESLLHILIWSVIGFAVSYLIVWAIDNDCWIIPQSHSNYIDLNGIEYLLVPIGELLFAAILVVFKLIPAVVKTIKNRKDK